MIKAEQMRSSPGNFPTSFKKASVLGLIIQILAMNPWTAFPGSFIPSSVNRQPQAYSHGYAPQNWISPTLDPHALNQSTLHSTPSAHPTADRPGSLRLPNPPKRPLFSVPQDVASLRDAELTETSMGPPPKRRKRKAPTLRAKDWEPYKARILELYDEQKLPLPKVKIMIEEEFGFTAELRQYRTRITQWGKDKNIKPGEMAAIVRKRQKRNLVEVDKRELIFTVRGRNVDPHKIDRWMARNGVSQTSLYAPSPTASTPSAVGCETISERDSVVSSPACSITSLNFSRGTTPIVSNPTAPSPISSDCRRHESNGVIMLDATQLLVHILYNQGLSHQSQKLLESLIESKKAMLGEGHLSTLESMYALSQYHFDNENLEDAEELHARTLSISKRTLGERHPHTMEYMMGLSITVEMYVSEQRLNDAEELQVQAVELSILLVGEVHPDTMFYRLVLENIYKKQGQLKKAEDQCKKVLTARKKLYGEQHPATIEAMDFLLSVYIDQGNLREVEDLGMQLLVASKRVLGEQHPHTLETVELMQEISEAREEFLEAEGSEEQEPELVMN
ncbi:kinesin light chain 2 [Fusarium sporotrichioides]|uniref:Kinesin light chain 2 n=1 Tax=Fusarium sporotrichioides TaxID=5514 RepID=A0A395RX72_FUSSP|nr:kinesin light chain 2 [Fusarium sporotrichioides]